MEGDKRNHGDSTLKKGKSKSYMAVINCLITFILTFNDNLELYIR